VRRGYTVTAAGAGAHLPQSGRSNTTSSRKSPIFPVFYAACPRKVLSAAYAVPFPRVHSLFQFLRIDFQERLKAELAKLSVPTRSKVYLPSNPDTTVISFNIEGASPMQSAVKVRLASCLLHNTRNYEVL
jgi:hypothetical protein